MTYEMPKLPYANNALEPVISQQTIDYHYGKHLQTYVNNLNNLVPGTEYENKDLVTIVATAPDGAIFNSAGLIPLLGFDVWEHSYYLDYQNRRADHVNALWSIIDWDVVGNRLK